MSQSSYVKCPDCDRMCASQGSLGLHCSKMHKTNVPGNIKSVNIVRLFPEGKSHYCYLCNTKIGSFLNFKRHFTTTHDGISLNISAKCVTCDREFEKSSGAGVHVKRAHNIGKDGKYPLSPLPAMWFIDMPSSPNNSCVQSRRSRTVSLVNSLLSGISNSHSIGLLSHSNLNTTADVDSMNVILSRSIIQVSPPSGSNPLNISRSTSRSHIMESPVGIPPPPLLDLDPDEVRDEVLSPSPPRACHTPTTVEDSLPSSTPYPSLPANLQSPISSIPVLPLTGHPDSINIPSSIEFHQPPSDPGVAFIGCTAVSSPVQSTRSVLHSPVASVPEIPLTGDSHSINIPSSIEFYQPPSDPGVAFVGCTAESCSVQSSHGILNGSSPVDDNPSNYSDNLATNPNNNREKESEFVRQWYDRISSAALFHDFSTSCGPFADDVVTKGKDVSSNSRGRPVLNPRNRPNGRVPNRNCRPLQFNPRDAKRLQILYHLSKKRAARQVLNDNHTPYSGAKDRAEQYFNQIFSPLTVDLDELLASLGTHVPNCYRRSFNNGSDDTERNQIEIKINVEFGSGQR